MVRVHIAVIGVGGVGRCFLSQLQALSKRLQQQQASSSSSSLSSSSVELIPVLLARSSKVLYTEDYAPLDLERWDSLLQSSAQAPLSPDQIVDYLAGASGQRDGRAHAVLVDNTSSQAVADAYPRLLRAGVSVVTPNKKAFSGSYALWQAVFAASSSSSLLWSSLASSSSSSPAENGKAWVYHESTVGAGLPVIATLNELVATGDEVRRIEGVFSGTMSFLFNSFAPVGGGGGKFSAEVRKAKDLGYTEPDPRDDLNGLDVARKLTILARLAGLPVESPSSFPVRSLIPRALESAASADEFLARLPDYDDEMEQLKREAAAEGKVVRYVGSIDVASKAVKVGLEKFDVSHPIAALKGSDNIVNFYTKRYGDNPLIIQGAGAGREVTAMGVTGDLIKLLQRLN